MTITTPKWRAALPTESDRVTEAYRGLLRDLDLTQRKLALEMGKSPQAVNHWATGRTTPPLEAMQEGVRALDSMVTQLKERVDTMSAVLTAVHECVAASAKPIRSRELQQHIASLLDRMVEAGGSDLHG